MKVEGMVPVVENGYLKGRPPPTQEHLNFAQAQADNLYYPPTSSAPSRPAASSAGSTPAAPAARRCRRSGATRATAFFAAPPKRPARGLRHERR